MWKTAEVYMDAIKLLMFFLFFVNTQEIFQRVKYKSVFFNLTEFSV
jgi:hypothetical protein